MSSAKRFEKISETTVTPTISLGAYANGDNIGGAMEFLFSTNPNVGGTVYAVLVTDDNKQAAAFDVYVFNAQPSAAFTDNVAFPSLASADGQKLRGIIALATTDYTDIGGVSWGRINGNDSKLSANAGLRTSGGGSVWVALKVNTSTPTYTATDSLKITLVMRHD
jgi:hypothetical protein